MRNSFSLLSMAFQRFQVSGFSVNQWLGGVDHTHGGVHHQRVLSVICWAEGYRFGVAADMVLENPNQCLLFA